MRFVSSMVDGSCSSYKISHADCKSTVLGAVSKVLATIVTHPLIVAKTMLQSKPPESRQGKPFKSFVEVLQYIKRHEGLIRIYKGIAPQIVKGFIVQGLMMMLKERYVSDNLLVLCCMGWSLTYYPPC